MKRRELLTALVLLGGGSLLNPKLLFGLPKDETQLKDSLSATDISLLNEVGEIILPKTRTTPGAKQAKVGEFIATHIQDCYSVNERKSFIRGLYAIDEIAKQRFKKNFVRLSAKQKHNLLIAIDKEAKSVPKSSLSIFSKIKSLIVFSFFTSELGATKCLRYAAIPGRYTGHIEYKIGDKAWY